MNFLIGSSFVYQQAIIIGKDATTVQSMTREAERHLEQLFGPVHLRLIVRVTPR
jgi:GTPase Era involved in 16S rRNA processing